MNKRAVIGGIFAVSTLFALQGGALTFAESSTDFSITTNAVLQLDIPNSTSLLLNPTSSAGDFKSTTITATVSTNNMLGYTLTVSPSNAAETTDLIGSNTNMPTLESSNDGYTESAFTANRWGYRLSDNSNYFGMPSTLSPEAWDTFGPTNETEHNLTLAAKVDGSFPAGSYATTLNFELVAKMPPKDFAQVVPNCTTHPEKCDSVTGKVAIQSIDEEVCNAVEVFDSQYQVTDIRDHKNYWISKLRDGNCWMTQNLDLDLSSNVALTSTTSDLGWNGSSYEATSWTPGKTTYNLANSTGDAWQQSGPPGSDPFSMDPGDWYEKSSYEAPTAASACSYPFSSDSCTDVISSTVDETKGTHGHIGNYYTWTVATANNNTYTSSGNIGVTSNSICPTNWRLPAVGDSNNDFSNINRLYNENSTTTDSGLLSSPIYFTRGGYVVSGPDYVGTLAAYWSNEDQNSSVAYLFFSTPSSLQAKTASFHKTFGLPVRCIGRKTEYVSISFDANGGTGSMSTQRIPSGGSAQLSPNTFTRDSYYFNGWNTRADGSGEGYGDNSLYSVAKNNTYSTTLYAQWTATAPICTANCDGDNPTYESGITIQRAYELAYTEHHLGMYEEQHDGQGDYARVDSWGTPKEEYKGYDVRFAMQDIYLTYNNTKVCDLVTVIGDQYRALDIRDNKLYYIGKMKDGSCWMTQNLDLDLVHESNDDNARYTHANTDLGWTNWDTNAKWNPTNNTISFNNETTSVVNWTARQYNMYHHASADPGLVYVIPSGDMDTNDSVAFSASICNNSGVPQDEMCNHYLVGNYYNWSAAIAHVPAPDDTEYNDDYYHFNDTQYEIMPNSICPAGWRLPRSLTSEEKTEAVASEHNKLLYTYGIANKWTGSNEYDIFSEDTFRKVRSGPIYIVRGGHVFNTTSTSTPYELTQRGYNAAYWSGSAVGNGTYAYGLWVGPYNNLYPSDDFLAIYDGQSIRCISR